ncbi:MAG: hypothetical protein IPO07_16715 [Haliscomenobacter sp.]|nr:hypothetical protein [Haliscomenobacter sp.]MBK9490225.1 hypothetical protein [Haliscomenobacter sp.]
MGDADNDPKNELQNLSLEGDRLKRAKMEEVPILTTLKAGTGIAVWKYHFQCGGMQIMIQRMNYKIFRLKVIFEAERRRISRII